MVHRTYLDYGDYRITPMMIDEILYDGVYYNDQGSWLGTIVIEPINHVLTYSWVKPHRDGNNQLISAPSNWQQHIIDYLGALDI